MTTAVLPHPPGVAYVTDQKPAICKKNTQSKTGPTFYKSPVAVRRTWSDGLRDIVCAAKGCDFARHNDKEEMGGVYSHNPLHSVMSHWNKTHDRDTPRLFPEVAFATPEIVKKEAKAVPRVEPPVVSEPGPEPTLEQVLAGLGTLVRRFNAGLDAVRVAVAAESSAESEELRELRRQVGQHAEWRSSVKGLLMEDL